ncbi:MAG TPA: PLP-dependent transferase [Solirubrobacteraceae bacterium]|jgi:cystathionine gamma-synthase
MSGEHHFATRAVHAGLEPDPTYGSVIPAIHQTSTFAQPAPGEYVEDFDYSRSGNPTRRALENALGELEGGHGTAFSSGMAATHALLTAATSAGDHVILPNDLYGGTYRLVDKILSRFGLQHDLVDQTDPSSVADAMRDSTRVVWVETPTNPLLNVVDVAAVVEAVAGRALVAVDSTFATPVIQRPLELGADAVMHSTTKYLGGHSDVIGGALVVRHAALHEQVRFVQMSVGAVPGPFDCFLVHRGLRTLHLRVRAHTENARAVVAMLREEGVEDVRWPGFGGMVSFRHPDALRIASSTKLFTLAESLGGVESLIEVPQAMTHQSVEGSAAAVPPDLVRLSCGVEAAEDLVEDLRQALLVTSTQPSGSVGAWAGA